MSMPLVSIMMPAWNAGSFIKEAIQSCLDQTYMDWELCIVDDGSDDDTYDIALRQSLKDNRIRVIRLPHKGCPTARNACLAMMTGDIVAKQDADDKQDPTRLEKQVRYLIDHDTIDIVTCRMFWLVDGKLKLQNAMGMNAKTYLSGKSGGPVCASIVAWKYVYDVVGPFHPDQLAGSDGDWNFRALAAKLQWGFLAEPLYIYRRHMGQITKRLSREQRATHEQAREQWKHLK